jgi:hypothetical protein
MICYNVQWMISLGASKSASLWKGRIYCILFSKSEHVSHLISKFLLYVNVSVCTIFSMKQNLFTNENSQSSQPDSVLDINSVH